MTSEPAAAPPAQEHAERVVPYIARILQQHLLADPDTPYWTAEGTALFADVSGFTQLSEQLARKGREGAEQITDTIGGSFASIPAPVGESSIRMRAPPAARRLCCIHSGA